MATRRTVAGSKAFLESEKAAIPDGKLSTPAPKITLARLKILEDTSDVPSDRDAPDAACKCTSFRS